MRINYNVQAMNANLALNKADDRVSQSIQRLSSGLKISQAKDSPSGYAMSKRMNLQLKGLERAIQSSNDATNIISIADGALQEVSDMIQRMNELSVKAANGTMSDDDRSLCQDEIAQLKDEIKRISDTTQFNGQTLLDGSFDLKGYTDDLNVKIATYSDSVPVQKYTFPSITFELDADGNIDSEATLTANETTVFSTADGFPAGAKLSAVDGKLFTVTAPNDFSITFSINDTILTDATKTVPSFTADITGLGAMDMQIGANEDQIIEIRIPALTLELMGIDKLDVSTEKGANEAISDIKDALKYVNETRSRLGAYQNRLEHTESALEVTNEAMTSAYSGLVDADIAEETVTYSSQQIISQAATSVLAQANDRPSQALTLLQ